jgi:hypothetical protein
MHASWRALHLIHTRPPGMRLQGTFCIRHIIEATLVPAVGEGGSRSRKLEQAHSLRGCRNPSPAGREGAHGGSAALRRRRVCKGTLALGTLQWQHWQGGSHPLEPEFTLIRVVGR